MRVKSKHKGLLEAMYSFNTIHQTSVSDHFFFISVFREVNAQYDITTPGAYRLL